jgi:hypothetical protein
MFASPYARTVWCSSVPIDLIYELLKYFRKTHSKSFHRTGCPDWRLSFVVSVRPPEQLPKHHTQITALPFMSSTIHHPHNRRMPYNICRGKSVVGYLMTDQFLLFILRCCQYNVITRRQITDSSKSWLGSNTWGQYYRIYRIKTSSSCDNGRYEHVKECSKRYCAAYGWTLYPTPVVNYEMSMVWSSTSL